MCIRDRAQGARGERAARARGEGGARAQGEGQGGEEGERRRAQGEKLASAFGVGKPSAETFVFTNGSTAAGVLAQRRRQDEHGNTIASSTLPPMQGGADQDFSGPTRPISTVTCFKCGQKGQSRQSHPPTAPFYTAKMRRKFIFTCSPGTGCT